jgi:DNA-directed RNA polymerase subunit F
MRDYRNILSLFVIVVPGLYFGIIGKPTEMGLAVVAGAIAASFINIDKIQRFKGAGFEAEMKKAVEEAYATVENLKELGKPLIISILVNITHFGRLGSIDPLKKHKIAEDLKQISKVLSLDDKELTEAINTFHRYHTWDLISSLIDEVRQSKFKQEIQTKLVEIRNYDSNNFPTKENLYEIFDGIELSEKIEEMIKDYDYYLKNKMFRRNEILESE